MPIQVLCTGCQAKLKAPDTAAGKKIRCPKCQTVVGVPAADQAAGNGAAAAATKKPEEWFLQTPDGSQYGPVPRLELDQWYSEGRVSAECQLLKAGSTQWQWAAELYPSLSSLAGSAASASGSSHASAPLASSPLTPLSGGGSFSDPLASPTGANGLSPLGAMQSSAATLPSFTSNSSLAPSAYGSPNPYSPSTLGPGYGAYRQPTGPHPMVIVAGIFHIMMGCWNAFNCVLGSFAALALMVVGGAAGAAGVNNPDPQAEGAMQMFAAFGVVGGIIVFVFALLFLAYGILQVSTAIGLFMRRQWARTSTFTIAGLGIAAMVLYVVAVVLTFDIFSLLALAAEIIYVPILFLAMLLPDANRGFR